MIDQNKLDELRKLAMAAKDACDCDRVSAGKWMRRWHNDPAIVLFVDALPPDDALELVRLAEIGERVERETAPPTDGAA